MHQIREQLHFKRYRTIKHAKLTAHVGLTHGRKGNVDPLRGFEIPQPGGKDSTCPISAFQAGQLIQSHRQMASDFSEIKADLKLISAQVSKINKYMFAGRLLFVILIGVAAFGDWVRDHYSLFKLWITGE